jgi:hypothetical protein
MHDIRLLIESILAGLAGVAVACGLIAIAGIVLSLLNPLPDSPDLGDPASDES